MQEVIERIVEIVEAAPEQKLTWDDLKIQLSDRERRQMFPAVRQAQQDGLLHRSLDKVDGKAGLTLFLKGANV